MDPNKYLLLLLVFLFPPRIISQIDRSGSENSNIVLLVADNFGYSELGFQGNEEIPTPKIDSL